VGGLTAILVVIHLIVSVLLVVLILMHSGKDSGMSSITGFSFAAQASVMERNLTRYTVIRRGLLPDELRPVLAARELSRPAGCRASAANLT
jgi:preprotein translocase subunit SecG